MIQIKTKENKGIALLMAVLISGLFFVISGAIYKIALIELILSSTGRDSQFAFYAADTGAECAIYWENKYIGNGPDTSGSAFNVGDAVTNGTPAYSSSNRERIYTAASSPISCVGQTMQPGVNFLRTGSGNKDTRFKIETVSNGYAFCAEVTVQKEWNAVSGALKTTITSRGYNTCNLNNPRRVERAIKVTIE